MNTWVNKRLANGAYDINELVSQGESIQLLADAGEAQTYLLNGNNGKRIIKVYKFALTDDLKITFEAVQKLRHPAIAKVFSFGELSGHAYEIREYYEQCNFSDKPENFITAIMEIADAINELHIEGLSSLDIKPENIVVTNDSAVIVDIGSFVGFKSDGTTGYTLAYSAPELDNGYDSEASDYYSLGISLFEFITGINPFKGIIPSDNEDTTLTTNLHNVKLNPQWWFPSSETENELGMLIANLINPDTTRRWGYPEIFQWHNSVDVNSVSKEIDNLKNKFHQQITYDKVTIESDQALVFKLIEQWDIYYLFQKGAQLSYSSIYLANKFGLFVAYTNSKDPGNLSDEIKASLLVNLYCEFSTTNDEVYLRGMRFKDVFELGNYVHNTAKRLYSSVLSNAVAVNKIFAQDDYRVLFLGAAGRIFSTYMTKCRESNVASRIEIISQYEDKLSKSHNFYDIIYGFIVISYAIMGKRIFQLTVPDSNRAFDLKSLSDLGTTLLKEMESIETSEKLLGILTYQNEISPILKAWSDSMKMNY